MLTPSATGIEKDSLTALNLEHISGTIGEFAKWLAATFPIPFTSLDLAVTRNPQLGVMLSTANRQEQEEYASVFKDVVVVSRTTLVSGHVRCNTFGQIRDFYRGFKPDWQDILDAVPAETKAVEQLHGLIKNALNDGHTFIAVHGPAGSGKATLVKVVALKLSDERDIPVYFIDGQVSNLVDIILALEQSNKVRYCIFLERLALYIDVLAELFKSGHLSKGLLVGTERQNIWETRVQPPLNEFCDATYHLDLIDRNDAGLILEKLEKFGPWHRLSGMSDSQRVDVLVNHAKRQLLIGLLETTSGRGFEEIIEQDYLDLNNLDQRMFLILVGFATIHRTYVLDSYVSRSLAYLGITSPVYTLAKAMRGIIDRSDHRLMARHPVYILHLFETVIEPDALAQGVQAFLQAFTYYEAPVVKKVGRNEGGIYKANINHKFLKTILRGDEARVMTIYRSFEKPFESDGLFWLQYGLALRDFGHQEDALEKLRTAYDAYPFFHTEHALAQQELIIAGAAQSQDKAYVYLQEARSRLERLDAADVLYDAYPIVTLSEGHTNVVRVFEGNGRAREIAKHYVSILEKRNKNRHDPRIRQAWQKLVRYTTTGEWIEEEFSDPLW